MYQQINNCLPASLLKSAIASWPDNNWTGWHRYKGKTADKYGSLHASLIPYGCQAAINELAIRISDKIGNSFIDYDLHAAGLHQIPPDGFLARHLDAEFHPSRPWKRTHSIILFLDDFKESDGGELSIEIEDSKPILIRPSFNTAIIFETDKCWHEVLRTSKDAPMRRTIALFAWNFSDSLNGSTSAIFS